MRKLGLFENQNLRRYLQNEIWGNYFQNKRMRKWKMTHDPKVAMKRWPCSEIRCLNSHLIIQWHCGALFTIGILVE